MTARNLNRLRAVMQTRGLTCDQVSAIVGRSVKTIHAYRTGERRVPDSVADTLEAWFRVDGEAITATPSATPSATPTTPGETA